MLKDEEARFIESFEGVRWFESKETNFNDVAKQFENELKDQATKKYVPIGTVVEIQNDHNKYMIIGFNFATQNNEVTVYPYGIDNNHQTIGINHNQIISFYHIGYFDMMGRGFQERLNEENVSKER